MHKLIVLTVVGWLALMSLSAASASSERTVRVVGGDDFKPNTKITSNLRFSPGDSLVLFPNGSVSANVTAPAARRSPISAPSIPGCRARSTCARTPASYME